MKIIVEKAKPFEGLGVVRDCGDGAAEVHQPGARAELSTRATIALAEQSNRSGRPSFGPQIGVAFPLDAPS